MRPHPSPDFIFSDSTRRWTVILPVVLYGCETWSLTLREKHRLRFFENRVLRRIFEPKREEKWIVEKIA
jgi:hypothetical protein